VATALVAVDSDVILQGPGASVERMFTVSGTLTVEGGATAGEVAYIQTDISGVPDGAVTGELVNAEEELVGALAVVAAAIFIIGLFVVIGGFIATLLATLLVIAFGTSQTRRAAATISNDVLKTIVVGLLMLIVPSILITVLFVTILGIPLAIGLMVLWALVAFLGYVVVGLWIGERILTRARMASRPYGAAFLGVLILMLLSWTWIVPMLTLIFGMGAVTLAGWRVLRGGGMPPAMPGYGQPYGQWGQPWGQPTQVPPPYAAPPYAPPPGQWPPQGGPPSAWPQG
jgi:hypothetical protein